MPPAPVGDTTFCRILVLCVMFERKFYTKDREIDLLVEQMSQPGIKDVLAIDMVICHALCIYTFTIITLWGLTGLSSIDLDQIQQNATSNQMSKRLPLKTKNTLQIRKWESHPATV